MSSAATKIIQLTDLHLVAGHGSLYGLEPRQRLAQAIDSINQHHADAELVVISGDLTHWGDPESYQQLQQELERLRVPVQLMLGNHDNREHFLQQFPDTSCDSQGFVQHARATTHGTLLFLDTNQPGTHAGHYCERRLIWLETALSTCQAPFYLFMHHPPFTIGIDAIDRIRLQDIDAFSNAISGHLGEIKHIFCGHVHRPIAGSWSGVPVSTLPSMGHQVALDLATQGSAIDFTFEQPSYGVILVQTGQLIMHMHDFTYDRGRYPSAVNSSEAEERDYALNFAIAGQTADTSAGT